MMARRMAVWGLTLIPFYSMPVGLWLKSFSRGQVGVGSPLEITDAEVSLANAGANYIQALYNYKTAGSKIENALETFR